MLKQFFLLVCFTSMVFIARAEKTYEFNSVCQQAYQQITQLKLQAGIGLIQKAKQQNPDNLIPLVLESYVDFFILFINEDPAEFATRMPNFDMRIAALKEGPSNSPFYHFCLGVLYLHKAGVNIKLDNKTRAGLDFQTAYKHMKQNKKDFSTFTPNLLLFGALQAVAGTIPNGYKWVASLFGIKGNIADGMKTITSFVNSNDPWAKLMHTEANFIYCYLTFYIENKKEQAIQYIKEKKLDIVNNHLFTYMAANLAINNKQNDYARSVVLNRNKSTEYITTGIWDFQLAYTYLHHLQTANAIQHFQAFLQQFRGKLYVKDVYQKLSWCYYLQNDKPNANLARKNVLTKGATYIDADKQALKEAKAGKWPNIVLLKARILNDGGYNNEANAVMQGLSTSSFTKEEEQLEFVYRVGRINDDLKKDNDAIAFYLKAIALGQNRTEYFAARAALQIGMIHERNGNNPLAIQYYQQCLDMEDHDYKNSLDQRAKAGIARCKGE